MSDAPGEMVPLARRNLLAEKGRFAMSVAGVAFAVLLVLIVLSLYRGWSGVGSLYQEMPGQIWVSQPGTSDPFHSTSFLPLADVRALDAVPGVRAAIPVYTRHIAFGERGHELDVFAMALAVPASLGSTASADVPPPGSIDVDRVLAGNAGVGVGDRLVVLGRSLVVARIHRGGNSIFQTAFLNAADAKALFGIDGLVNFALLDLRAGADLVRVQAAVTAALPGTETHTAEEFATSFADRVNAGFLAVVGGAVIALTTYTATVEKAREFGVLKAVGASGRFLYRVVVDQSLIVGSLGSALGIVAAVAAARLIKAQVPEFITVLRWTDAAVVFAGALATAVLASYVPVRRIERIDPAEVFRP